MRVLTNEKTRVAPVPAIHRMVIMLEAIDGLGGVATVLVSCAAHTPAGRSAYGSSSSAIPVSTGSPW
jgi:hypothetical protein